MKLKNIKETAFVVIPKNENEYNEVIKIGEKEGFELNIDVAGGYCQYPLIAFFNEEEKGMTTVNWNLSAPHIYMNIPASEFIADNTEINPDHALQLIHNALN